MAADHDLVIVELHGRLGNQLFQFASGWGLARGRDAGLAFASHRVPTADLLLPTLLGERYREASTVELRRVGHIAETTRFGRLAHSPLLHTTRALRKTRGLTRPGVAVWEQPGVYRSWIADLDLPVYLQGHLQSERYFESVADQVFDAIAFPDPRATVPRELGTTLGLSFRRGDYNSLGWALPLGYYDDAVQLVTDQVAVDTIVLFGDDDAFLELAEARYSKYRPVVNAVAFARDPVTQLDLLAACDHCVIANSSFAWWGAWIGDHRTARSDRVVVAPTEYGADNDRLPARWTTVDTGLTAEF